MSFKLTLLPYQTRMEPDLVRCLDLINFAQSKMAFSEEDYGHQILSFYVNQNLSMSL